MPAPTAHSVMISDSRLRRYARKFPGSYRAAAARLDKLKHVPQCAARKLSAVSFQHSALERHEIVAACKEYGGIVIQKRPTERSGLRKELYA